MNKQHFVILGAGFAGMMATLRLSRRLPKDTATITLVNATGDFVERTRLHQFAAGQHPKTRQIKDMLRGTRVDFVQGRAIAIQPDQNQLTIETSSGSQSLTYDLLLYALGSRTDRERIAGLSNACTLDAADATRLAAALPTIAAKSGRVLVIGGGLTGIEAATEIAERYPVTQVSLATRGTLGDGLSPAGAAHTHVVFDRLHIRVHDSTVIGGIDGNSAVTASGERVPFDVCINCAGFVAPSLARQAGLAVNDNGQLLLDATLRSISCPAIYGAGDAAAFEADAGMPLRMACATAIPMATQAADNIVATSAGKSQHLFAFGYVLRCISLGRRDGLVQFVDARDVPQPRVVTGRRAVWIKEMILRSVMSSLDAESRFGLYHAPHTTMARPAMQPTIVFE